MSPFADIALASRIERLGAESQRSFVAAYAQLFPELGAESFEVAGGVAAFLEHGSPVNGAVGLGLDAEATADDIAAVEAFFRDRAERPLIALAPPAHPSLLTLLGQRGWVPSAFENVLVRDMVATERFEDPPADIDIRVAGDGSERALWAALVANGFSAPDDPSETELRLGRAAVAAPDGCFLIAYVDGRPAGTGELHMSGGIGWLSADTTLPGYRRRGVQRALQCARLAMVLDAGCELALTEAIPGSGSQRNMERLGFTIAYTRVEALAPDTPT